MYRDGYALVLAAGATSLFGFAFWAVAARSFPAHVVGIGSAAISSMMLLAGFSQVGLTNVLVRFLPGAGRHTGRLLRGTYVLGTVLAAVLAIGFLLGQHVWAPSLDLVTSNPGWIAAFVGGAVIFAVFSLQDSAMVGLGESIWVPVENAAYSALKLLLVVLLASRDTPGALFIAWTVPAALALAPVNAYIYAKARRVARRSEARLGERIDRRSISRFVVGNGVGAMFYLIATSLLPLLVLERLGADQAAYLAPAWAIATALQLATAAFVASLTVEGARNPGYLQDHVRRSFRQVLVLIGPIAFVTTLAAPQILGVFGEAYAHGAAGLLRWIGIAMVPHVCFSVGLGVCRVLEQSSRVAIGYALMCVPTLALSILLMPSMGLTGIGVAWFVGQACAAVYVVTPNYWVFREH
jgi:O-antigen/teichoic acid export membrane protein